MTFTLAPEAKITGQVTDQQGRPVRNAEVKVFSIGSLGVSEPNRHDPETLDLAFVSRLAPIARTDADGKVSLAGLPPDLLLGVEVTTITSDGSTSTSRHRTSPSRIS